MHVPVTTARPVGLALAVLAAVAVTVAGSVSPGVAPAAPAAPAAGATSSAAVDEQLRQRLELACARVPAALDRTEALQARLDADERTRGSLLWLEAAAARARGNGRDDLAGALDDRLRVRRELADLLPQRLVSLGEAQASCTAAGL